jgi:hypothetical protein
MLKSMIKDEIFLPAQVIELNAIIEAFKAEHDSKKRHTKWYSLCTKIPSLTNYHNRSFNDNRINNLEFSRTVGRAYSDLFQVKQHDIIICKPSTVIKIRKTAAELIDLLSNDFLYSSSPDGHDYIKWLHHISALRPSDLSGCLSNRGNPIVRWLIIKIAEEFCYSFDSEPTSSIIGDVLRLGWPKLSDRSIRNTFTSEASLRALESARVRRENDNKSKTITHQVISTLSVTNKGITDNQMMADTLAPIRNSDKDILKLLESNANLLNDNSSRLRVISLINAIKYEEQEQDIEGEGN